MPVHTGLKHPLVWQELSLCYRSINLNLMMKGLFLLFMVYQVVCCHKGHRHKHTPQWLFLTQNQSKAFLRHIRSAPDKCIDDEAWCEVNKQACYVESASESYCSSSPTQCSAGQECYLIEACPAHFRTGCRDFDECESNPCQNGGSCVNGDNSYTCNCHSGYMGNNCQTVDWCASNPCKNAASCINRANTYKCNCVPGYTGTSCQTDIDECNSNPCLNGGTCSNLLNRYTCDCPRNFIGTNCETDACHAVPADVVFLLDSSQSKGNETFNKQLDFILSFINHFEIGPDEMQIAVITYSFDAKVEFYLNTHFEKDSLQNAITAIQYDAGATYTGSALKAAYEDIFLNSTSGVRVTARKCVILLTDGMASDRQEALEYATILRLHGVKILTIGTGSRVSHLEMLGISGESSDVFTVKTSDALNSLSYDLAVSVQSCDDCNRNTSDVLFLVDRSTNVSEEELNGNTDSIMYLLSIFNVDINDVRVGIVTYAEDVDVISNFDSTFIRNDIYTKLQGIFRLHGVHSNTTNALTHARQHMFTTSTGHRENSRKIVILLSSGRFNNGSDVRYESQMLKSEGISLAVVGYGKNVDRGMLLSLVSDPHLFFNPGDVYGTQPSDLLPPMKTFAEYSNCSV